MGANVYIYVHTDDDEIAFRDLINQVGYLIQIILVLFCGITTRQMITNY